MASEPSHVPGALRRVAVLRNQFLPYSETFIHDELRSHERYTPTVLARRYIDPGRFPGHEVVSIETARRKRPFASLRYGLFARAPEFDAALARGGFALLHAHFGHNGAYALGFARRHGLPLVVSMHGHDVTVLLGGEKYHPNWWFYLSRYRRLFREAALILPASTELSDLLRSVGCPPEKLRVHRLGVDLAGMDRPERRAVVPGRVVMVGRFVEKKGHQYGFRALSLLQKAGQRVDPVVIGDGPLRADYERLLAELGLDVRFTGALSHSQVLEELSHAEVLLAPSVVAKNLDRESGLIVAKEASALAVPVVGTRHGGLPEIVEDGRTGYLVAERDPQSLAQALSVLLGDRSLSARMGEAAREKMQREYDLRARVRALECLYDEVIERGAAR